MKTLELYQRDFNNGRESCELERVPEFLKEHSDGCLRSCFFSDEGKQDCFGPMTLVFAVRTAKDLLLEGCEYQGLEIKLETAGKILPQLPAASELSRLLEASDTLVYVNGQAFKPNNEVFGFQQVYDDSVKCIENLKKIGFNQESMAIFATPDDISVEINGSALGLEGNSELSSRYYKLLCHLASIKDVAGKPQKTDVKTILLNTVFPDAKILVPGALHPTMRRPKVGVGPSHFAYGIAAFSDFCGKKRKVEECLQETFTWLKFLQKQLSAVEGVRQLLDELPEIPAPGKASVTKKQGKIAATVAPLVVAQSVNTVFQPLKAELDAAAASFKVIPDGLKSFSPGFDKALGKGWSLNGIHIIAGNREVGKSTMLIQQALLAESKIPVLFISFEQNLRGFIASAAGIMNGINRTEVLGSLAVPGTVGDQVRLTFGAAIDRLQTKLSNNLFFSGIETGRTALEADEIAQLASMLPPAQNKLVIIDAACESDFNGGVAAQLHKLRNVATENGLTVIISLHTSGEMLKRPNIIDETDMVLLDKYQRYTDTIVNVTTEKANLRKFVAMIKGQVDPILLGSLEQKSLQLCGGKRLKGDTYTLVRFIHNRNSRRDMLLFLYQPDTGKFFELATVPLSRA